MNTVCPRDKRIFQINSERALCWSRTELVKVSALQNWLRFPLYGKIDSG